MSHLKGKQNNDVRTPLLSISQISRSTKSLTLFPTLKGILKFMVAFWRIVRILIINVMSNTNVTPPHTTR